MTHAIDPAAVLTEPDDAGLETEARAYAAVISVALASTATPAHAFRAIAIALGVLCEESTNPAEVFAAGIELLYAWCVEDEVSDKLRATFEALREAYGPAPGWQERVWAEIERKRREPES